ncbi:MAG: aminotransferase class I/II-fold pyridoxal phosphate-dependent enzyme, partial [Chloroflexi bacterium]|nr:aminotransferase class I/II-fold pyridoxal phosphate-dependent enzyme [Chloroflexota bacterium]
MNWIVPLSNIVFGNEEKNAVKEVLDSGWLTMGAVTQSFEKEFAAFTGAKHALAVANATDALHMACVAAGIGPGDEVIVPSLTFVATANAVRYTGATPVFADITSENDLTISLDAMKKLVPDSPQKDAVQASVEIAPVAYLRGRTFDNCVAIFDEAQNATRS